MLELFKKHVNFLELNLNLENEPCEKRILKFKDEVTNKHYLSFFATYKMGRKSAFDDMGIWAIQNVGKVWMNQDEEEYQEQLNQLSDEDERSRKNWHIESAYISRQKTREGCSPIDWNEEAKIP